MWLTEFGFLVRERFSYEHNVSEWEEPVWQHEIRLERMLMPDHGSYPRFIAGAGSPPLDRLNSPQELSQLTDLFTPRYVIHRLAELVDQNLEDHRIAQELRCLRPWLTAGKFSRKA
jgi:hypothetical protein